MSAAKLYRVRWERDSRRGHETESRLFRQRIAAVRWLLTMEAEGHDAHLDVAPMPEWASTRLQPGDRQRHAAFVRRRVDARQAARERWADA